MGILNGCLLVVPAESSLMDRRRGESKYPKYCQDIFLTRNIFTTNISNNIRNGKYCQSKYPKYCQKYNQLDTYSKNLIWFGLFLSQNRLGDGVLKYLLLGPSVDFTCWCIVFLSHFSAVFLWFLQIFVCRQPQLWISQAGHCVRIGWSSNYCPGRLVMKLLHEFSQQSTKVLPSTLLVGRVTVSV